jgi:ribosomal protein L30E
VSANPTLRCAVSGEPLAAQSAIWLVAHPQTGEWFVDVAGKLPGEKTPIACNPEVLGQALAARGLDDAQVAHKQAAVAGQLQREALGWLPLALKAGKLIVGFDSVNKALRGNGLAVLVHATDGSDDGLRKMAGIAKSANLPIIDQYFNRDMLASALGMAGSVVHLGLAPGGIAQNFLRSCQRLAGFTTQHKL